MTASPSAARFPPFEIVNLSIRLAEGGRAQLRAECGYGLAIVPVEEERTRLKPTPGRDAGNGDIERAERVRGFSFYHVATGARLLPAGWFFTSIEAARAGLHAIGARIGTVLETPDINAVARYAGPVFAVLGESGVIRGKWHDLKSADTGSDADWDAGAEDRRARMKALKDDPKNTFRRAG
jgi:hypothetical protein